MGDMGDALFRAFTKRSPKSEGRSMDKRAGWFEKAFGGAKKAAEAVGVSPSTWRRWKSGKSQPKPESLAKANKAARGALVPEGRRKRVKASAGEGSPLAGVRPSGGLSITATVKVSEDEREREINLGGYISEERMNAVMGAFLDGNDARATQLMQQSISEYVGRHADVTDVSAIHFDPMQWNE
jgi:hypothetical protein